VFVPRRCTEFLVQQAAALLAGHTAVVVDLCCGSGAVGAALAASAGPIELHAADIDPAAVRCACRNVASAGGRVYQGDRALDGLRRGPPERPPQRDAAAHRPEQHDDAEEPDTGIVRIRLRKPLYKSRYVPRAVPAARSCRTIAQTSWRHPDRRCAGRGSQLHAQKQAGKLVVIATVITRPARNPAWRAADSYRRRAGSVAERLYRSGRDRTAARRNGRHRIR
jgi:hypothetical protein